ncbi:MAG: calcium/sodium antiporter [Bacteroidota bacterium]
MSGLLIWAVVFLFSLATLIFAADFFIKASENLGIHLGIPAFIVGVTLVAIGTSLPELVTSALAVAEGVPDLVLGNVVGSNIANLCLVLGMMGIIARRIELNFNIMKVDLPMMMGATLLLIVFVWNGTFSKLEAIIFLLAIISYLGVIFFQNKPKNLEGDREDVPPFNWTQPLVLVISGIFIYFSAKWNVESIKNLADILSIGTEYIAQTAVAFGTSLPELVVSIMALKNNNADIAVGNILGSNIFNIFAVMGLPRLMGLVTVPESMLGTAIPVLLVVTIVAFFIFRDKIIKAWEGWILISIYAMYVGSLVIGT